VAPPICEKVADPVASSNHWYVYGEVPVVSVVEARNVVCPRSIEVELTETVGASNEGLTTTPTAVDVCVIGVEELSVTVAQ
jgi:hypothetical protein